MSGFGLDDRSRPEAPATPPAAASVHYMGRWQKVGLWAVIGGGVFVLFLARGMFAPQRHETEHDSQMISQTSEPLPMPPPAATAVLPAAPMPVGRLESVQQTHVPLPGEGMDTSALNAPILAGGSSGTMNEATPSTPPLPQRPEEGHGSELADRLSGMVLKPVRAVQIPHPEFTIEQGRTIPCVQASLLVSDQKGFVTAEIPENVRGMTGAVKALLPKGTKLFGSMESGLINGSSRVFVVWEQATTPPILGDDGLPHVIRIPLDSPATDELGAAGLDGDVNRHMWRKVGGAVMLSLVQGGIQAAASLTQNSGSNSSSLNLYQFQGQGQNIASQLLQSQLTIPDTVTRNQGSACNVVMARDADFSDVYSLEMTH